MVHNEQHGCFLSSVKCYRVPKTIDNDVYGTDVTFGFDTAVNIATDAMNRLHSTASSHRRVMVIELMGHHAGWITLYAGMAGGADIIILPELGYNMKVIIDKINKRMEIGKPTQLLQLPKELNYQPKKDQQLILHAKYKSKLVMKLAKPY